VFNSLDNVRKLYRLFLSKFLAFTLAHYLCIQQLKYPATWMKSTLLEDPNVFTAEVCGIFYYITLPTMSRCLIADYYINNRLHLLLRNWIFWRSLRWQVCLSDRARIGTFRVTRNTVIEAWGDCVSYNTCLNYCIYKMSPVHDCRAINAQEGRKEKTSPLWTLLL
jgi:hypothetical protein